MFQNLINSALASGFLAAFGVGMSGKMAPSAWIPGIIYTRRTDTWRLLEEAAGKLRTALHGVENAAVKQRLVVLAKPGLDGVDGPSYAVSYLGWKDHVVQELKQLEKTNGIGAKDKQQLERVEQLVTEIDEHARAYWKHRMTKALGDIDE